MGLNLSSADNVGISQVQVERSDGFVLATAEQVCDYTYPVPCPPAQAVPVQIDTTKLSDGVDPLRLVATDTAENSTTSTLNVLVANHAPPQPTLAGAPVGWTTRPAASIVAQVPASGVPIARLEWMLCSARCGPANLVPVSDGAASVAFDAVAPADGAYTVEAATVDVAGHRSATSRVGFDVSRAPPAPPTDLTASGAPGGPIAADWTDPAHPAPITTAFWQLCPRGRGCGPVSTGSDRDRLTIPASPGAYSLRVWLGDAAGNADPARAATATVTVPRLGATPALAPRPGATVSLPVATGRDGVRLYTTLRRLPGRGLEVALQATPKRPGSVGVGLGFRGHRVQTHTLRLHRGAAALLARIPRGAADLTVTLHGLGATATRRVHLGP
jgi:hypothetical protein